MPFAHLFRTSLSLDRFRVIVSKASREPHFIYLEAHDRGVVPPCRLISIYFTSAEDRDRVRIALRQLEKTQASGVRVDKRAATPA